MTSAGVSAPCNIADQLATDAILGGVRVALIATWMWAWRRATARSAWAAPDRAGCVMDDPLTRSATRINTLGHAPELNRGRPWGRRRPPSSRPIRAALEDARPKTAWEATEAWVRAFTPWWQAYQATWQRAFGVRLADARAQDRAYALWRRLGRPPAPDGTLEFKQRKTQYRAFLPSGETGTLDMNEVMDRFGQREAGGVDRMWRRPPPEGPAIRFTPTPGPMTRKGQAIGLPDIEDWAMHDAWDVIATEIALGQALTGALGDALRLTGRRRYDAVRDVLDMASDVCLPDTAAALCNRVQRVWPGFFTESLRRHAGLHRHGRKPHTMPKAA